MQSTALPTLLVRDASDHSPAMETHDTIARQNAKSRGRMQIILLRAISVIRVQKAGSGLWWKQPRNLEAPSGFEPLFEVLQTSA